MAGRKEYELMMKLTAALGPNFSSTFQNAINTTNRLQESLQDMRKTQGDISAYRKTQDAINATKTKLGNYAETHNSLQGELVQTVTKERELQAAVRQAKANAAAAEDVETYKRLTDEHDNLQKELSETTVHKRDLERQIRDNQTATEGATRQLTEQEQSLAELSNTLREAGINTNNLSQENENLQRTLENLTESQEEFNRVSAAIENNNKAISATRRELLTTVGVATAGVAALYKGFVAPAAQVEAQLSNVRALTGATAEEMVMLGQKTQDAWQQGFTQSEIANVFEYMANAGWQADQMKDGLDGVLTLINATGEPLGQTVSILKDAITAFGASSSEAGRFGDVLVATASNTNTAVGYLGKSFQYVAPVAGALGFSVEDTALMLGVMADNGIKGSQAGTALRATMTGLLGNTDPSAAAMYRLGVEIEYADGTMRALGDIIGDLRVGFGRLTEAQRASYAQAIAGQGGMSGLLAIVNTGEEDYYRIAEAIFYAEGAAAEMADIKMDNFEGQMRQARAAADAVRVSIGEALLPIFMRAAQALTGVTARFAEWAKENQDTIITILKVVAGLTAAKIAFLAIKMTVLKVKGVFLAFKKVIAAYNLVKAGMAAGMKLSTALTLLDKKAITAQMAAQKKGKAVAAVNAKTIKAKMKATKASAAATKASTAATLLNKKATIAATIKQKAAAVASKAWTAAQWALNIALKANPIGLIIMAIVAAIAAIVGIVVLIVRNFDKIRAAAARVWEAVKNFFGRIREFIAGVLNWIKENWQTILVFIMNPFAGIFKFLYENFEGFRNFVDNIISAIKAAFFAVVNFFRSLITSVGQIFKNIWGAITGIFSNVVTWFAEKFTAAWEAVKSVFSAVGGFFKGIWDSIVSIFSKIGTAIGDAIGNAFKAVVNAVIGFAEGMINTFIRGINRAIGLINLIPRVNIPTLTELNIPRLEKGSNRTPDTFIAGDVGGKGGELVTGARGRKVFTAAQTTEIFNNINKAKTINKLMPQKVSDSDTPTRGGGLIAALKGAAGSRRAPETIQQPLPAMPVSGGGQTLIIENKPTIQVNGNVPGDLDKKLQQNNENLFQMFKEWLRQREEDERRTVYD